MKATGIDGALTWRSEFNKERREKSRRMKKTWTRMVRMKHISTAAPFPTARTMFLQNVAVKKTQAIIKSCTCYKT